MIISSFQCLDHQEITVSHVQFLQSHSQVTGTVWENDFRLVINDSRGHVKGKDETTGQAVYCMVIVTNRTSQSEFSRKTW